MKTLARVCLSITLLVLLTPILLAEPPPNREQSRLAFGVGDYNFLDDDQSVEFRLEWHGQEFWRTVRPLVGFMTSRDDAYYGFAGVVGDYYFSDRWVFSLQSAVGYYEEGDGKDLGHAIEFKTAGEIAYRFENQARLGLQIYHLSNAGIDKKNPGTEILSVTLTWPLD